MFEFEKPNIERLMRFQKITVLDALLWEPLKEVMGIVQLLGNSLKIDVSCFLLCQVQQ